MLTKQRIEALLKLNTQNNKDTIALRIMSCSNPIKELYVYELSTIKKEYEEKQVDFDKLLTLCILKFNREVMLYLNSKSNNLKLHDKFIHLNNEMIKNAKIELQNLYSLLRHIIDNSDFSSETINKVLDLEIDNYIAILQLCGIVNISNNIFKSKILSIFLIIKEELNNYIDGRMNFSRLLANLKEYKEYILGQINWIDNYFLYDEDFLIYIIMFDTKKINNIRKKKQHIKIN